MDRVKPYVALLCVLLMLVAPAALDAQGSAPAGQIGSSVSPALQHRDGFWSRFIGSYQPRTIAPANMGNSNRLDSLLRGGNLYLSLQDAIALALENNLDIEIQRYGPQIADADVLAAQAGGFARGVSTTVTPGPASASITSSGTTPGTNQVASSQASAGTASAVGGSILQQSGAPIPSLDPMLFGSANWAHNTTPQSSAFVTGTNSLIQRQDSTQVGIQKGFLTGTQVSLGLNNNAVTSNNPRSDFNPSTTSSLSLTLTQHLLQGFGTALNSRQIHIAKNNREVSDLTFKLQVVTTVAAVMELYWDLVAFNEQVRVARDALAASERLYNDNKRQVEVGTLAPIEVVRAEAEVASGQQQLTVAQTHVLQQETILKSALSKNGVASPSVAEAHIIPTDRIRVPDVEPISPIQDLMAEALATRPELAQSRIQINNQELTIRGSKNGLLPTLDAVVQLNNGALAGQINPLPPVPGSTHSNNPFFLGGYGTVLSQLFSRNFPSYAAGFNLNIPLRNRSAQAQLINDELTLRQQQLALQRLENQVRVDVQNALIGLTQARAQYQAATKARVLQEQTLDAERKKLDLGASTIYNVILDQRDLVTAESNEVTAMSTYANAKVELDRATGELLNHNNVSLDEAYRGVVSRPPSPIPAVPPQEVPPPPAQPQQ
ncbi:MAG TPA: TolC family protein [Bryobacteraceae bacterium]|nr:TolC family protein [Bryobacteraceae bacterium]